jgi:uncharacterized membrane protein YczE
MTNFRRLGTYILGLFILALGVSVSVKSDLGVSPVSSLPYVLSLIFSIEMGYFTMGVFILFILVQLLILKRDFKITSTLQILSSVAFGYFVNLSNDLVSFVTVAESSILRLFLAVLSSAVCGLGIFLYVESRVMPLPAEGLTGALSQRTGRPFSKVKVFFDLFMVGVSAAVSLGFLGAVEGIGWGTVISALLIGRFVGLFSDLLGKRLKGFFLRKEIQQGLG